FGGTGTFEQTAMDLVLTLLLLADVRFLGAAIIKQPADHAERLKVGGAAFEAVDVMTCAGTAFEAELRSELGLGGANFLTRRGEIRHRFVDARVVVASQRFRFVERSRHARRKI